VTQEELGKDGMRMGSGNSQEVKRKKNKKLLCSRRALVLLKTTIHHHHNKSGGIFSGTEVEILSLSPHANIGIS
jgi:hypothetical protein